MAKSNTWVLVAEASRAKLFTSEGGRHPLQELEDFIHAEGRMHEQELGSDQPGRAFDSAGRGRHAMEQKTSLHRQAETAFARQLNEVLLAGQRDGRYQRLCLVAPPEFLGLLRESLDETVRRRVIFELDKNLTQHSAPDIREHLPETL